MMHDKDQWFDTALWIASIAIITFVVVVAIVSTL